MSYSDFLMMAILTGAKWYLIVVLTLQMSNVEYPSMCFLPSVCLLWTYAYLDLLAIFSFFFFKYKAEWAVYIFWRLICCQSHSLQKFFSPILWVIFSFSLWFPCYEKPFKFNYILFVLVFIFIMLGGGSKNILLDLCHRVFCLCFL